MKLFENFTLKLVVAEIFIFLSWSFKGDREIIAIVYTLITLDTITGVWVAIKDGNITSRRFFRSPVKFIGYLALLVTSRMVDKALPLPLAAPIMDAFLVTTEAVSILENFYKLGFPVPLFLVNKLKTFYEKKG